MGQNVRHPHLFLENTFLFPSARPDYIVSPSETNNSMRLECIHPPSPTWFTPNLIRTLQSQIPKPTKKTVVRERRGGRKENCIQKVHTFECWCCPSNRRRKRESSNLDYLTSSAREFLRHFLKKLQITFLGFTFCLYKTKGHGARSSMLFRPEQDKM